MDPRRTRLTVVGRSPDGAQLLLQDPWGNEFTLEADARLRATLRAAQTPPAEGAMEGSLRPRDIQTRIRAGQSAEEVAAAAGAPLEQVMVYASPVLAERAHKADRAQRASVRRLGEAGGARTLGEAVSGRLMALNIASDKLTWDSWRREDGRWQVTALFVTAARSGRAQFAFDVPGNFVLAENDDALWLLGDSDPAPAGEPAAPPVAHEPPALDDSVVTLSEWRRGSGEPTAEISALDELFEPTYDFVDPLGDELPATAYDFDAAPDPLETSPVAHEPDPAFQEAEDPDPAPAPRREVRKTRGRASVPSWDEIMFGPEDS